MQKRLLPLCLLSTTDHVPLPVVGTSTSNMLTSRKNRQVQHGCSSFSNVVIQGELLSTQQEVVEQPVALSTEGCSVEGLTLLKAFVSEEEAQVPNRRQQRHSHPHEHMSAGAPVFCYATGPARLHRPS